MVNSLSIARMRKRLPLIVCIFLVLIVVMLVGLACACLTDHPMQAIEKALSVIPAAPAIVEVWATLIVLGAAFTLRLPIVTRGRASPALLQRFLF